LNITSSPNPVGSGARALGMGGAFIAVADDATAASWNPGGLTQLERPELSAVYDFDFFRENFTSAPHPELDSAHEVNLTGLNYLSVAYPIPWTIAGRNLVLSLNYQRTYDFNRKMDLNYNQGSALGGGNFAERLSGVHYRQTGQLGALSPAIGFEITDQISVGAVLNLYYHDLVPGNGWEVRQSESTRSYINGILPKTGRTTLKVERNYDDFEGMNATIGTLYKPTDRLSFGAVYHTAYTAQVKYTEVVRLLQSNAFPGYTRAERDLEYHFPQAYGIGVAYRFPKDKLTLSFDVTRRDWDQYVIHDPHNPQRSMQRRSGVTGLPKSQSPIDPTYQVRLGGEYVFVRDKLPKQNYLPSLRAGIFYDPEPSGGTRPRTFFGLGKGSGKVDDYYGFSLGGGLLLYNRVNFDIAYVYRFGNCVRSDTFGLRSTYAGVDQHYLYLSTVIYF
jgi:long-subunit fatty acid transport protein